MSEADAIRPCRDDERPVILSIVNTAAEAYRGLIPADRWHEPYMPSAELEREIRAGVVFWGYETGGALVGVMGVQPVRDVTLIRHAYVLPTSQRSGIGGALLEHLRRMTHGRMLVGTWAAADWAVRFYRRHGFEPVARERGAALLRAYWSIPDRQIQTSVVLADPPLREAGAQGRSVGRIGSGPASEVATPPEPRHHNAPMETTQRVSDQIEAWLRSDEPKTLGSLIELFEEKSFAVIFVLLLGVPALPLPTGGATHVFEVIAMLLSLQLIVGRRTIWLPRRWRDRTLEGAGQQRFVNALLKTIRWLERFSRPRLRWLFHRRASDSVFGLVILLLSIGAFLAPPFTGLDTLPALGAVVVSLGVLLEDVLVVLLGLAVGTAGVVLEIVLGRAAFAGASQLISQRVTPR